MSKRLMRKNRWLKRFAVFTTVVMLLQIVLPPVAIALSGGPSQPELQGFSKVSTGKMVDPFSGDFQYSVPLLDVGGYPLNLSYNSNISMDQEASWVGLGWSLNPGNISRQVRGLPDDFMGSQDKVTRKYNLKDNETYGADLGVDLELFAVSSSRMGMGMGLSLSGGLLYNTYNGMGISYSAVPSLSAAYAGKLHLNAGMGINASSESGANFTKNISIGYTEKENENMMKNGYYGGYSSSYNSRQGLTAISLFGGSPQLKKRQSHTFTFADNTYTPTIQLPMQSIQAQASFAVGSELFGAFPSGRAGISYSIQSLISNKETLPAYGYIYAHKAEAVDRALLDFNREKDGPFSKEMPYLPVSNFTYDVFSASGPGISGSFRPHRNDIGELRDHLVSNTGTEGDISVQVDFEAGVGNAAHVGADIKGSHTTSISGAWITDNKIKNNAAFRGLDENDPLYEPVFFKSTADKTVNVNPQFLEMIGGTDAVRVSLQKLGNKPTALSQIKFNEGSIASDFNTPVYAKKRQPRNTGFSYLTADVASRVALNKKIRSYRYGESPVLSDSAAAEEIHRVGENRKNHHISEVTVTDNSGSRYVYGIPAYNKIKKEVSFNVADRSHANGLVDYVHGTDNSKNNERGKSHYYSETITPAYAHSYLLTAVISNDYEDIGFDGPTPDDFGTYLKYNYNKAYDDYRWRTPYEEGKASFSDGNRSVEEDDMGNYMYGEKEIWFLHSIETKNYIALFHVSVREDALEP